MLMSYTIHLSTLNDINLHLRTIKISFLWFPVNGPSLSECENTHTTMFRWWRRKLSYIIKLFLSKRLEQSFMFVKSICIAWPQTNGDPAFCKVHCQSLFCGFRVLCVSWSTSRKEKQADYHHHSAHERLYGQCFCFTSSYKSCETTVCATLVQFLFRFYSVLVFVRFFPSDATFRWSAVVNLPETNHSTRISLKLVLFWSATTQTMASRGIEEPDMLEHPLVFLISVHFWRSRQWEVDRDSA